MPRLRPAASLLVTFGLLTSLIFLRSRLVRSAVSAQAARTVSTTPSHSIAFFSLSGNQAIYTMNPDGSHVTRLTNKGVWGDNPFWSPDSSRVAFESAHEGNDEIYVMDSDGSHVVNVSHNPLMDFKVSWSPDSQQVAFHEMKILPRGIVSQVYRANVQTGERIPLAPTLTQSFMPLWSPQGDQVLFTDHNIIYLVDIASGVKLKLIDGRGKSSGFTMSWAPDGRSIAIISNYPLATSNNFLFLLDLETRQLKQLIGISPNSREPVWSPDSEQMALLIQVKGSVDIYTVRVDGSGLTNLTNSPESEDYPDWSPDGKKIVFTRLTEQETNQIYVMNADGSNVTQLTTGEDDLTAPHWLP